MIEKTLKLRAPDGHLIYGTYWLPKKVVKGAMVVIVHGLTGSRDESKNLQTAEALLKMGIPSLRISLYSWEKKARQLLDCTIETHTKDLSLLYRHLQRMGFTKIIAIGHSLGWPVILGSDIRNLTGVISWDGTTEKFLLKGIEAIPLPKTKYLLLKWGNSLLIRKDILQSKRIITPNYYSKALRESAIPWLAVIAEKSILASEWKKELKNFPPGEHYFISKAGHNFTEYGCEEKLVKITVDWCNRVLNGGLK